MNSDELTIKQESFCQAYVRLGDKSAAYREAYNTLNMKPETIHARACKLANEYKVSTRIDFLRNEIKNRSDINIDELISILTDMTRFNVSEMYNSDGTFKSIHDMSLTAKRMISSIEINEVFNGTGKNRKLVGYVKKVRLKPIDSIEKLMRHLGGYKSDNEQTKPEIAIVWHEEKTYLNNENTD